MSVSFIKKYCRDYEELILYADNCNAQNKNKILRIVNDVEVSVKVIKIEYLEPVHTYMSADSVHGSITKRINASGDLDDYINTIKNIENT